ncbi:MAG: hypothetical protein JW820_10680 [Spirochaetales bacterium]|nr:hypothetical protein [Spirochaetales bacterium]
MSALKTLVITVTNHDGRCRIGDLGYIEGDAGPFERVVDLPQDLEPLNLENAILIADNSPGGDRDGNKLPPRENPYRGLWRVGDQHFMLIKVNIPLRSGNQGREPDAPVKTRRGRSKGPSQGRAVGMHADTASALSTYQLLESHYASTLVFMTREAQVARDWAEQDQKALRDSLERRARAEASVHPLLRGTTFALGVH